MTEEIWKPVVGFEGLYEVSDHGRVKSLPRYLPCGGRGDYAGRMRFARGCVLRPAINTKRGGYRYVNLRHDNQQTARRVCVLVAAAFIGPRPEGQQTRHKNGKASDDRADNLCYGTPKENTADRKLHGTYYVGEAVPVARLTEAVVREILSSKSTADFLGAKFDVHPGHINNIRRGVRWGHVRV